MTSRIRVITAALTLGFIATIPAISAAQTPVAVGVKAGVNAANLKFDATSNNDTKTVWKAVGGLFATKQVNDNFGVQVEGLFSQKGAQDSEDADNGKISLTYVDVPVLLRFGPTTTNKTHFHVFTGPQLSFNTKAEQSFGGQTQDLKDDVKGTDFGWVAGVSVEQGRFNVDARYALGLSDIAKDADSKVKNRVFSLTVGVKLTK